jgi:hypothetical protein
MFIFFEASNSLFVAVVETTSRSSPDTRARLHKVEAAKEGLLLGESAEYDGLHYVESFFYGWDRTRSFFRFLRYTIRPNSRTVVLSFFLYG